MSDAKHNLAVGQRLWFVPEYDYLGKPRYITVEKSGRKWSVANGGFHIDLATLCVKGGVSGSVWGMSYLHRADWEKQVEAQAAWRDLCVFTINHYRAPAHLTAADIRDIAKRIRGEA